jgi:IS5 family transposase
MLIDQYAPEDVFAHVLELDGQTDPVLWQLDRLLEDEELYHMVRRDLGRRYPQTLCRGWSYRETERRVADSLVLRWFCRVYFRRVPDATTLWSTWLATRVTSGRKLRIDATVVETAIHHPTDGSLLVDSVRVLSRVIRRIRPEAGGLARWHPTYLRATRRPPIYVPAAKSQHQIVLQ